MTAPRVSVVMAARNAEATIKASLRSLQRQTLQDWECLLVDDDSSDATVALAAELAAQDSRIRLLPAAQAQAGVVAACNRGARLARAPTVAILDADDLAHRKRLALQ
jgi:glycosyltransferase involved in cell wall biosynthesis